MATSRDRLEELFPGLQGAAWEVTSPEDPAYNCVTWGLSLRDRWWWPEEDSHWPPELTREESLSAFLQLFAGLGFSETPSDALEPGLEKIALFARESAPTHVARQLDSGSWSSKLGAIEDISHPLRALEGVAYGRVVRILARPDPRA